MIDINAYIDELEQAGMDLQALINKMYNRADGTGEAAEYNNAVIGMDVKDRIVKLVLLNRAMLDKVKGDIESIGTESAFIEALNAVFAIDGADVKFDGDVYANGNKKLATKELIDSVIDNVYIREDVKEITYDDTGIFKSDNNWWVGPLEGYRTVRFTIPQNGFMRLQALVPNVKYGYSNDGDGLSILYNMGTTIETSADLHNSDNYAYLYVMTAIPNKDYGVSVKHMTTLRNMFDTEGIDAQSIASAVEDIEAIGKDFYRLSEVMPTILEDTWIYQRSGAWYCGSSTATAGYTVYRFAIDDEKTYKVTGLASEIPYGFANTTGREVPLTGAAITKSTSETITSVGRYLYIRASSPKTDYGIKLYEIVSLREEMSYGGKEFGANIYVAASNATAKEKLVADYICDGINDGEQINAALDRLDGRYGTVILSSGTFCLDTVNSKNGKLYLVSLFNGTATGYKRIRGQGAFISMDGGTVIKVTNAVSDALDLLDTYDECKVFGSTRDASMSCYGCFDNIRVSLSDNRHRLVCIDNSMFNGGRCDDITLDVRLGNDPWPNTSAEYLPSEGCVGIRGYDGHNHGCINEINRCFAQGFYEAFQLGGEHLICRNLGARYNYYSYTFGHYTWTHGKTSSTDSGTQSHPITLINCADEGAVNLPKFFKCGQAYYLTPGHEKIHLAKQEVNFIDFTIEFVRSYGQSAVGLATEEYPGAFCGKVDFTMNGSTASFEKTGNVNTKYASDYGVNDADVIPAGTYGNHTNAKFWADGMGHNFVTRNMTHKQGGTTAERESYEPMYMQLYYDTDLRKLMIYDGTAWVSAAN